MTAEGPFKSTPTIFMGVRCQDSIIDWILYPEEPQIRDETAGHYIAVSRMGLLSIWTKHMKKRFETTIETSDDGGIYFLSLKVFFKSSLKIYYLVSIKSTPYFMIH